MDAYKYVKRILSKVHCGKARKRDIKMQLLAEIDERVSEGENLSDVISQMGSVSEVADSFNENISASEKRKYRVEKVIRRMLSAVLIIVIISAFAAWLIPKGNSIESSTVFTKDEVEKSLIEVIKLLDEENYSELKERATSQMTAFLDANSMKDIKAKICADFGNRVLIGTIYDQEIVQYGRHFAVCQVNVSYENVNIIYTITFDKNMKLAGLYMK